MHFSSWRFNRATALPTTPTPQKLPNHDPTFVHVLHDFFYSLRTATQCYVIPFHDDQPVRADSVDDLSGVCDSPQRGRATHVTAQRAIHCF